MRRRANLARSISSASAASAMWASRGADYLGYAGAGLRTRATTPMSSGCASAGPSYVGHEPPISATRRWWSFDASARQSRADGAGARIPVVRRAEMLAELMRLSNAGRHRRHPRKTTTTSRWRRCSTRRFRSDVTTAASSTPMDQRPARRRRLDGVEATRATALPQAARPTSPSSQHRSRAPDHFVTFARDQGGVPRLRRELPFYGSPSCASTIRRCRRCRPDRRSTRRHLWREPRPTCACSRRPSPRRHAVQRVDPRPESGDATFIDDLALRCRAAHALNGYAAIPSPMS